MTRTTHAHDAIPRLFLKEAGWSVRLKPGSDREFCHQMAPGQDFYHRLAAGEVYLVRGDEKLCLPCAARRGLFESKPRGLYTSPELLEAAGWPEGGPPADLAEVSRAGAPAAGPARADDSDALGWDLDLLDSLGEPVAEEAPPADPGRAEPPAEEAEGETPWWRA